MAIHRETIEYASGNTKMRGHLACDDARGDKLPGILVCHEWWGVNDYIRGRAEQLAELGYVALAIDMFGDGKSTSSPEEAGKLMTGLMSNPDAMGRVKAALTQLQTHPKVDSRRVGAIGYCMGGAMCLNMARAGLALKGVVSFHGSLAAQVLAKPNSVQARILVCHGADDPMVGWDQVEAFKKEMTAAGVDYQLNIYGGAQHAFTNPNADHAGVKGLKYDPRADRRSWQAMQLFFAEIFS